jgi:DnaJ-class molecular chaperone
MPNQMPNDPYALLGLTKSATAAEIKQAYRRLARSSHPDLNLDDAGAEARFKSISGAYDLLKDPATRARFDAGEIDAAGAERPPRQYYRDFTDDPSEGYRPRGGFRSQFGAGGDPNDIFADILRQRGGATGDFAGQGYAAPGRDLRFEPPRLYRRAKLSENCPLWNRHKRRRPRSRIPPSSANVRCGWLWNTAMSIRAKLRR